MPADAPSSRQLAPGKLPQAQGQSGLGEGLEGVRADTPASHTLSVSSREPDTIVLPSGEKATDITQWLCALCFSALSSKEAAASTGAVRFELRVGGCRC